MEDLVAVFGGGGGVVLVGLDFLKERMWGEEVGLGRSCI